MIFQKNKVLFNTLKKAKIIFWDFDGVIKDSVHIKNSAYLNLFSKCELSVTKNIKKHLAKKQWH